jgi:hypothetical protein
MPCRPGGGGARAQAARIRYLSPAGPRAQGRAALCVQSPIPGPHSRLTHYYYYASPPGPRARARRPVLAAHDQASRRRRVVNLFQAHTAPACPLLQQPLRTPMNLEQAQSSCHGLPSALRLPAVVAMAGAAAPCPFRCAACFWALPCLLPTTSAPCLRQLRAGHLTLPGVALSAPPRERPSRTMVCLLDPPTSSSSRAGDPATPTLRGRGPGPGLAT